MVFIKRNFKLFVLSGKARSGKDTIAKTIENYYKDKKCITISFGHYIKDYAKRIIDWDGNEETKPREFLQQFGISLIKEKINDKLFINRILEDIEIFSYFYDIIIIDDVRLLDEITILKDKYKNLISIRVLRKDYDNKLTNEQKNHITEVDLDKYEDFDYKLTNYNNQDELIENVEKILKEV